MRFHIMAGLGALAVLAACKGQEASEQPGNQVMPSAETRTEQSASAGGLGQPVDAARAKALQNERHEGMEEIGDAMKILSREAKADAPNLEAVRTNAAKVAELAPRVSGWFPPGSGPEAGETDSKAEIWQKPEDFAAKTRDFQQAAIRLNAAAQAGDVAAIKAAHGELGKSCKACHDPYRVKD